MTDPLTFLQDLARDLAQDRAIDGSNQASIIKGYARLMELREEAIRAEASDCE